MIIGISGKAGSGKDTVADRLVKKHGFVKVALADPMKRFCMEVFDFTEEQLWGPSEKRNRPDKRFPRKLSEYQDMMVKGLKVPREYVLPPEEAHLSPRYALQTLGTEWGRNCYNDVWVDYALRVAKKLLRPEHMQPTYNAVWCYDDARGVYPADSMYVYGDDLPSGVVIPDIRFTNELAAVKKVGKVVRIVRAGAGLEGAAGTHQSEAEQDGFTDEDFDHIIVNQTSMESLLLKVDQMVDLFSGRITPYDEEKKDVPPFKR